MLTSMCAKRWRFEFAANEKSDMKNGNGAPCRGQICIGGSLIEQVDLPLTALLSLDLGGEFA